MNTLSFHTVPSSNPVSSSFSLTRFLFLWTSIHYTSTETQRFKKSRRGKSGSGKSTLFKLAYGLIKPTKGQATINGVETYRLSETAKRKIFGIVYQDYYFSGGTIKEEVTLLNPEISDEQVYKILKLVELDRIKDINVPLKINDYSTGELSLFNIARAIIMNSKILFLDEMNAKIDQVTAQKIINVINNVAKDKIILSINHYGHLLENSDILNLEKENTNE